MAKAKRYTAEQLRDAAARHDMASRGRRMGFLFRAIVHFDDAANSGRDRYAA